jgi:hypothetical protein
MPALHPVDHIIRTQLEHSYGGIPAWTHVFSRYSGSAPTATDIGNLAGAIGGEWVQYIAPLCGLNIVLQQVVCTDLSSASAAQGASATTHAGTRAGASLTANDCGLMNLHVARRYRGGKPRQYWPIGVVTDVADPQHWTAAFQTAAYGGIYNFLGALIPLTWPGGQMGGSVNVSYYEGFTVVTSPTTGRARNVPTPRAVPLVDNVSTLSFSSRIATQRRRQHFSA